MQDTGRLVTVGMDGSATLMELCEGLHVMQPTREAEREPDVRAGDEAREEPGGALRTRATPRSARACEGTMKEVSDDAIAQVEKEFMEMTVKSEDDGVHIAAGTH